MEPGTVYSLTITPIVHGKSGRPKLVIFTTEPKRVTNLEVDIDVDCTTEIYSPLLNVQWDEAIIDDSRVNIKFAPAGPKENESSDLGKGDSGNSESKFHRRKSFTMVTPGAEYEISVNKWSIKNIESRAEVKKIIGTFSITCLQLDF